MAPGDEPEHTENAAVSRRGFLKLMMGFSVVATLAGVLTPILGYLWPPAQDSAGVGGRVQVGTTRDISPGQGKVVPVNNKPVIVVNTTQGVKAFSAVCTHLGCIVEWDETRKLILCPCHDGRFNPISGAVISGPPPRPLTPVDVVVDGENIYVGGA